MKFFLGLALGFVLAGSLFFASSITAQAPAGDKRLLQSWRRRSTTSTISGYAPASITSPSSRTA